MAGHVSVGAALHLNSSLAPQRRSPSTDQIPRSYAMSTSSDRKLRPPEVVSRATVTKPAPVYGRGVCVYPPKVLPSWLKPSRLGSCPKSVPTSSTMPPSAPRLVTFSHRHVTMATPPTQPLNSPEASLLAVSPLRLVLRSVQLILNLPLSRWNPATSPSSTSMVTKPSLQNAPCPTVCHICILEALM